MITMSQIALGNYPYILYPFEYFLDAVQRMQIDHIELWAAGPHLYLDDVTYTMAEKLKRDITARGLKLVCVTPEQCMYPINIGAHEPQIRKRSVDYFKKAIDIAEVLGCKNVLVTPGDGYRNQSPDEAVKYTIENLQKLSDYAAHKEMVLFLEHLTVETTNVAVKAWELARLAKQVSADNLICMVDTDMMSRYGESIADFMEATKGQIGHVHFIDGMPSGHLALGDGILPLEQYLKELNDADYQGYLTLEILSDRYHLNPDQAVIKSLVWLREHLE